MKKYLLRESEKLRGFLRRGEHGGDDGLQQFRLGNRDVSLPRHLNSWAFWCAAAITTVALIFVRWRRVLLDWSGNHSLLQWAAQSGGAWALIIGRRRWWWGERGAEAAQRLRRNWHHRPNNCQPSVSSAMAEFVLYFILTLLFGGRE